MTEATIFETMSLPEGSDWLWYEDCNLIALSDRLDSAGRLRAIEESQEYWQKADLRLVVSA